MKLLHLWIGILFISFCIVSVIPYSYSMCMGTFQPNIQKDNEIDSEGYHTYLAAISDNQTYPIKYKISSGAVIEAISSETSSSSILNIIVREVPQGGNLTIRLPTKLLGLYSVGDYSVAEGTMCAEIINKNFPMPMESNLNFTTVEFPLMNHSGVDEMIYITGNQQPSTTSEFPSPLKQFKSGTPASDVKCNDGLQLLIKAEDGSPACVKPDTTLALESHGWTINQKSTIMHVELDQSHYPSNNLDYFFVKGTIYTTSGPMQNSTLSIFGNNIPLGNAMTDPMGCFQFDSWNNTEINQEMYNASSNHQESYTLKITSSYLGDGIHDAVNDTKSAVVYFQLFPIPPPFYVSSTNPQTIQVKQGDSASLKLSVTHLTGGPVGQMELIVQRLPCGITYKIPSNAASNNGTFNISITTQDYTRVGKYYLDVIQDTSHFENPNIIPDPYIGTINLEVLSK